MKKIILSVAVAAMALSTTASALEDIKVNGQAKLWYETNDLGDSTLTDYESSTGEVVFKLGMTGKQGNVGFGATLYQVSSMGLEGVVVGNTRTGDFAGGTPGVVNDDTYVGEAYITAPIAGSNLLKFGKQELDTPLAFTERWNATPNTFNAAVLLNNSVDNLTLVGAYVGQASGGTNANAAGPNTQYSTKGTFALAGLYKTDAFGVNVWAYQIGTDAASISAYWVDASMKAGPVALKAYAANLDHDGVNSEATTAFALSAGMKAGDVSLFAAASTVGEGDLAVANTATGNKKTKLPTAGVYTDGKYVAQPGATAFKIKASGKAGTTGIALQAVMNSNSYGDTVVTGTSNAYSATAEQQETTEVDLIVTQKLGDFNMKAILMQRTFADSATDDAAGGIYARVIASVNF